MRATGITQSDLARALGCTRGAVGHYLAARRKPNLQQLEVIAQTLGLNPAWLQFGSGSKLVEETSAVYLAERPFSFRVVGDMSATTKAAILESSGAVADNAPYVSIPRDCYALMVKGSALAPRMYEGDVLLISPSYPISPGSEVFVGFSGGESQVFNLVSQRGEEVTLGPLATNQSRIVRGLSELEFVHAIVAVVNPAMLTQADDAADLSDD